MEDKSLIDFFARKGVRLTANRLRIARLLRDASNPLSLAEIEAMLDTIDRSNIFRTLVLLRDNNMVHTIDDGSDSVKYELMLVSGDRTSEDMHVHFHCVRCGSTRCFTDVRVPKVSLPEGYIAQSVNYVVKGICEACNADLMSHNE